MFQIIKDLPPEGKNRGKRVLCKCDCGKEVTARKSNVLSGNTTSCGCQRGKRKIKSPEVTKKCENKSHKEVAEETIKSQQVTPKVASQSATSQKPMKQTPKPRQVTLPPDEEDYDRERIEEDIRSIIEEYETSKETVASGMGMTLRGMYKLPYKEFRRKWEKLLSKEL